jgi:UDP-glucuronate decarboxylase
MVFRPLPQDDPMQRRPDITQAKRELDWEPQVKLREGLGKTIAHFAEVT